MLAYKALTLVAPTRNIPAMVPRLSLCGPMIGTATTTTWAPLVPSGTASEK
jgi:hypothetical protein